MAQDNRNLEGNDPILYAYSISGDGSGKALNGEDISQKIREDHLAWVHLDATNPATRDWLEKEVSYLDPLILDALLAEETRPRMVEYEQGALMILRGVNLNDNANPEDMVSVRAWVDRSRIITLRKRPLKAVRDIADKLDQGSGPKDAGDFVGMLSARLFERMEPVFSDLDDRLDMIEEDILDKLDTSRRKEIVELRKQAIIFRRYIAPQKDVMSYLRTSDLKWLDADHKRLIQEAHDRVTRYVEDLDTIRERAQIVKDELANGLADRMNKNMYVLSIVAAIFLPLGFLTGLLGINVGGMPGADSDIAFWVVCAMCIAFAFGLTGVFRLFKWL